MLRVMRHYNIPAKLCSLIKSLYDKAISAVRVGKDISDWFSQTVGDRQGCTLSPDLFNLFLEHILSKAKEGIDSEFGIRANGERFTDLCFADDIVILSETVESAQSMLQQINDASSRYGMDISKAKFKVKVFYFKTNNCAIKYCNNKEATRKDKALTSWLPILRSNVIYIYAHI